MTATMLEVKSAICNEWDPQREEIEDFVLRRFSDVPVKTIREAYEAMVGEHLRGAGRRRISDPRA